jgi:hypothetical protein
MRSRMRFLKFSLAASAILAGGIAWTTPPPPPPSQITYSGRAFGALVAAPPLVPSQTISDTGELAATGEPLSAEFLSVSVPNVLSADLIDAHTSGANGVAESSAMLAGVNVLNGLVTAAAVSAQAVATCNGVQGFTEILDLSVGGMPPIAVDPFAANQKFGPITVDGLSVMLTVNEQLPNPSPGSREITVNAIHLVATDATGAVQAQVILSSARSDIHGCPGCPPVPSCDDFVTGGGWIDVPGGRASFGFNAGHKGGSLDVHFNYVDHRTGMHMKAVTITKYAATGPTSRHFEGAADIDGHPGTYIIDVTDNGEPGRNDTLAISLSNGYKAGGSLAGGNIKLHKPCADDENEPS